MKKKETRKLALNKETIRKLNDTEMKNVVGGTGSIACGSRRSACCPCTGTSNPPTSPVMCPTE